MQSVLSLAGMSTRKCETVERTAAMRAKARYDFKSMWLHMSIK